MANKVYPLRNARMDGPRADEKIAEYIRVCIPGWDGVNWKAVREYLINAGRLSTDLDAMDMESVWMAFATGAQKFITQCGTPETHTPTISTTLPQPQNRRIIYAKKDLTPTQRNALEIIKQGPIDGKTLAARLGIEPETLRSNIIPALKHYGVDNPRDGTGYLVREPM